MYCLQVFVLRKILAVSGEKIAATHSCLCRTISITNAKVTANQEITYRSGFRRRCGFYCTVRILQIVHTKPTSNAASVINPDKNTPPSKAGSLRNSAVLSAERKYGKLPDCVFSAPTTLKYQRRALPSKEKAINVVMTFNCREDEMMQPQEISRELRTKIRRLTEISDHPDIC